MNRTFNVQPLGVNNVQKFTFLKALSQWQLLHLFSESV